MRLAVVSTFDLKSHETWSNKLPGAWGASYYLAKSLEKRGVEIDYISPLNIQWPLMPKIKAKVYQHVFKKNYKIWAAPSVLDRYAQLVSQRLRNTKADIVFCPKDVWPIAHLNTHLPIVFYGDAANGSLVDYYWFMCNLCRETRVQVERMERAAFQRCEVVGFYSQWAADDARRLYSLSPEKLLVVEAGGNLDVRVSQGELEEALKQRANRPFRLVFLGQDWIRKGGPQSVEIVEQLNRRGINSELIVIGCAPSNLPSFVKVEGFLDKAVAKDKARLIKILSESHFLVLISKAETYGHVLCEANALGTPCLTSGTGAMPCIVKHNINGGTFSPDTDIETYVNWLSRLATNPEEYETLARQAWQEAEVRLNWDVAAASWCEVFERLVERRVRHR